jgi:hypothetical protein
MDFLVRSVQRTTDIAGGYIVGYLAIENGAYIQKENGEMVEVGSSRQVEVKNGDQWERLTAEDLRNNGFAGLEARMI